MSMDATPWSRINQQGWGYPPKFNAFKVGFHAGVNYNPEFPRDYDPRMKSFLAGFKVGSRFRQKQQMENLLKGLGTRYIQPPSKHYIYKVWLNKQEIEP